VSNSEELPFLAMNLAQRYNDAFALLKFKFGGLINDIHVKIAVATGGKDLKND